ncbi:hypothetical protein [uncultured Flavobacterium sp.]|uniref:hypothetical protein n=1 Tax=uncultured Flavobacterium sp. TaxID=165435 RepID=UPI0030ED51C9|tara:strand:+ start:5690 stop:5917 length:228 start_codon:yes stop_codon:yes gene_type:complete
MSRKITIPIEQYKCLREHLKAIELIINGNGGNGSKTTERITPIEPPKESKLQKVNKYKKLIASGERVKKPNHLRK